MRTSEIYFQKRNSFMESFSFHIFISVAEKCSSLTRFLLLSHTNIDFERKKLADGGNKKKIRIVFVVF